mgnify:CR=1 FL=1
MSQPKQLNRSLPDRIRMALAFEIIGLLLLVPVSTLLLDKPLLQLGGPANEHATHEHHGKSGPAGPHFQRIAQTPLRKIAAEFNVLVCHTRCGQRLARFAHKRVARQADHHHSVLGDGVLHLLDHGQVVLGNALANGRMDGRFGQ